MELLRLVTEQHVGAVFEESCGRVRGGSPGCRRDTGAGLPRRRVEQVRFKPLLGLGLGNAVVQALFVHGP